MKKKNGKPEKIGQQNTWLNFLDTVTSIVIIPILVLSVVCSIVMINAKRNNNVPNIFGYSLVTVLSPSMVASGFEIDDAVMVKKTDTEELKIGDIIAYYKYIEKTDVNLSDIARASEMDTTIAKDLSSYPDASRISSWKLYLSKLFSNATYTSTEASEKAKKANSAIIFHQVVDIIEYDGYKWFRTWGTSNVNAKGDPIYDTYWIREDYVIGKYTHTSSAVRGFLGFASTNSGILWMVEVPSGIHLILSTLELVEILDMMTRERHERIKNGTYIDRKEYKKMLRAKRKLLASGNIDVETFKKMYPTYENYDIFYSLDEHKDNVNINGPPISNDGAKTDASTYGKGGAPPGLGPPGQGPPNGDDDDTPPKGGAPQGAVPGDNSPTASGKDLQVTQAKGDSSSIAMPDVQPAQNKNGDIKQIDKSLYKVTASIYEDENKEQESKDVKDLALVTKSHNAKVKKQKTLGKREVILSDEELSAITDIYHWDKVEFIANTEVSFKGIVKKPSKFNKIYLVSKADQKQYTLSDLGIIYSVNTGLITSEKGLFRFELDANGLELIKIDVDPAYTIISAKQDIFGNIFIGVKGGSTKEIVQTTSRGKHISIWNRNALLTLGDNKRLYYMSMNGSYDHKKGTITDVKVMSADGKLISVDPNKITTPIKFVDGYEKYGFIYIDNKYLCLDKGKMFFDLNRKQTVSLKDNEAWLLSNSEIAALDASGNLIKLPLEEYLTAVYNGSKEKALSGKEVLCTNVKRAKYDSGGLKVVTNDGKETVVHVSEFILHCHLTE